MSDADRFVTDSDDLDSTKLDPSTKQKYADAIGEEVDDLVKKIEALKPKRDMALEHKLKHMLDVINKGLVKASILSKAYEVLGMDVNDKLSVLSKTDTGSITHRMKIAKNIKKVEELTKDLHKILHDKHSHANGKKTIKEIKTLLDEIEEKSSKLNKEK